MRRSLGSERDMHLACGPHPWASSPFPLALCGVLKTGGGHAFS
jgi:hypothetical protein